MIRLFEDFSHYGKFNEIKPKKGEFFIFEMKSSKKIYLIEILNDVDFENFDVLYSNAYDHMNNISFRLYYDYRNNTFSFGVDLPAKIVLRTMKSEEAFDYYNMIKNIEKYNL